MRGEHLADFREVLRRVDEHPNRRYFVLKSIIVNNLYGVDIMEEAVEICKLRMFLKLAAQVEPDGARPNMSIEPLPDIDFNIRAGNTLVGFATLEDVGRTIAGRLADDAQKHEIIEIEERAAACDLAFRKFRESQLIAGSGLAAGVKQVLEGDLRDLNQRLDRYLAAEYGKHKEREIQEWRKSHQPLHWFSEFHGIMMAGGFDVIIGNPPYVEWAKLGSYTLLERKRSADHVLP